MNEMARIAELERQREEEKIQQAKVRVDKWLFTVCNIIINWKDFEQDRQMHISRLPVEPVIGGLNIVTICIKMLDGQRIERRFQITDQLQVNIIVSP